MKSYDDIESTCPRAPWNKESQIQGSRGCKDSKKSHAPSTLGLQTIKKLPNCNVFDECSQNVSDMQLMHKEEAPACISTWGPHPSSSVDEL